MTNAESRAPAQMLPIGGALQGGWHVLREASRARAATGAHFSHGYVVEHPLHGEAFLKAIDFAGAMNSPDPVSALGQLTRLFEFERDLHGVCRQHRMSRVVAVLDEGIYTVPGHPLGRVQYLIFELADGDIRAYREGEGVDDLRWMLRCMHSAALGLAQLHARGIVHQDVKPSNVMTFGEDLSKLGDLGRASRTTGAPSDALRIPGDITYAAPELFWIDGRLSTEWNQRRAADLFMLGGLLLFQLTDVSMPAALWAHLDPAWMPVGGFGPGRYIDALPYLRDALDRVAAQIPDLNDDALRAEVVVVFRELCDPDPTFRGDPKARGRHSDAWSLERYVSRFDRLARQAAHRYPLRRQG